MSIEGAIRERDRLTGVYSRDYFDETAREIIDQNPDVQFAFIELDINRLTVINELYGVSEGDNVLKYMGATLEEVFKTEPFAMYARIQADLFAILCVYDKEKVEKYVRDIEESIHKYSLMINLDILLSFGIYIVEERNIDVQLMRDRAKLALKTVKGNYIRHYAYYDAKMHEKIADEQVILQNMQAALENGEFVPYYQPKHSLDDESIIGAEALVRWISPEHGMISPARFIPIFERNGFIMKLDRYVWEEVCKFIKKRLEAGADIKPISVNISRINLYNPELVQIFKDLVKKYDIPTDMLELEFTESAYTDNPQLMLQTMAELQKSGFKVEMDDFGSGYSSLNMLKDVAVDVLKIDLNFLSKTSNSEKAIIIMSSIMRMARWLGIPSIVEGVETEEQIQYLKSIGCPSVQGYYFSKPLPEAEFIEYMDKYKETGKDRCVVQYHKSVEIAQPNQIWEMITANRSDEFPIFDAYGLYEIGDNRGEIIRVSDGYYKIFKTSREKSFLFESDLFDRIHPDDREALVKMFKKADDGYKSGTAVIRRICDDGEVIWVYVRTRLLGVNSLGDAKVFYVGINDISSLMDRM